MPRHLSKRVATAPSALRRPFNAKLPELEDQSCCPGRSLRGRLGDVRAYQVAILPLRAAAAAASACHARLAAGRFTTARCAERSRRPFDALLEADSRCAPGGKRSQYHAKSLLGCLVFNYRKRFPASQRLRARATHPALDLCNIIPIFSAVPRCQRFRLGTTRALLSRCAPLLECSSSVVLAPLP